MLNSGTEPHGDGVWRSLWAELWDLIFKDPRGRWIDILNSKSPLFIDRNFFNSEDEKFWRKVGLVMRLTFLWEYDCAHLSPLIIGLILSMDSKAVISADFLFEVFPELWDKLDEWPQVLSDDDIKHLELESSGVIGSALYELFDGHMTVVLVLCSMLLLILSRSRQSET